MEIENAAVETGVVDGTVETFGYEPNQFHKDELIGPPYIEKIIVQDSENVVIYGLNEQRIAFFTDWANYIGEVQNPENTAVNPFFKKPDGTGSLYAPLSEVLNTTRPTLAKYGFGIFQSPLPKTGQVSIGTIITHKAGCFMSFPNFTLPSAKNDAQGLLSTETYARRGSLNAILGIQGEVDDDGNNASGNDNKKGNPKPESNNDAELKQTINSINALATELGGSKNEEVMGVIKPFVSSGNTNLIKDIKVAKELHTSLLKFRENKKAVK